MSTVHAPMLGKPRARVRVFSAKTGCWYELGNGGEGGNRLQNWLGRRRVRRWNALKAKGLV